MRRRDFFTAAALSGNLSFAAAGPAGRPHLFYDERRIKELRGAVAASLRDPWITVRDHATSLVGERFVEDPAAKPGGAYEHPSGQCTEMGFSLGFAYHMTGDRRFADKARAMLLHYAAYRYWSRPILLKRDPPWHADLNTHRFCFGCAAAFDAVYDLLSSGDRQAISSAIAEKGVRATLDDWITPVTRVQTLDTMGHNWWSACVGAAGVAACALVGSHPNAVEWVERAGDAFTEWFDYRGEALQNRTRGFDRNGGFYESVNYAGVAISNYLRFHLARTNVLPGRTASYPPILARTGEFYMHTLYPTARAFRNVNFGDGKVVVDGGDVMRLLLACGIPDLYAATYLKRTRSQPKTAFSLAIGPLRAAASDVPDLPLSQLYSDIGWAMLRSSWKDDGTLLAMRSGYTWGHAHADAGSYMIFHAGVPLITDSGNCTYARKEYTSYYRQTRAHNVILFNGQGEPAEDLNFGVKFTGRMACLLDGLGMKYVYADAAGPDGAIFFAIVPPLDLA